MAKFIALPPGTTDGVGETTVTIVEFGSLPEARAWFAREYPLWDVVPAPDTPENPAEMERRMYPPNPWTLT